MPHVGNWMKAELKSDKASWLQLASSRNVVRRSTKVSMLVGTILVAINQGNLLLGGVYSPDLWWKIPLTYCVPFAVSTYAAVDAIMARQ